MTTPSSSNSPNISVSMTWAFNAFKRNAATFLALAAVVVVVQFAQLVAFTPILNTLTNCLDASSPGQELACRSASGLAVFFSWTLTFVFALLAAFATIGVLRAALRTTQGVEPSFADMLTTQYLLRYIGFAILFNIAFGIGFVLCFLPALAVIFFFELGHFSVLDRGTTPFAAFATSFRLARANPVPMLMIVAMVILQVIAGSFLFGLVTLVVLPFTSLFIAHVYRSVNGESVAS